MLPDCCRSSLPEDWIAQAEAAGACVLRDLPNRDEMLAVALERLGPDHPSVDAELTADFLALGFCHLQVELLTRKLRYMSNLDEASLQTAALAAAAETLQGNVEAARSHLQSAFDRLHEAREYFYPSEARLLDLTLVTQHAGKNVAGRTGRRAAAKPAPGGRGRRRDGPPRAGHARRA